MATHKVDTFAPFRALLMEAEALFDGVQRRLAAQLGIDATRYNKLRTGTAYHLNVENCLRLAALLKRTPGEVLRAANKAGVADLLDAYYGVPHYEPWPGGRQAQQLASEWARLTESQRELVLRVMGGLPTLTHAAPASRPDLPVKTTRPRMTRAGR